MLELDRYVEIRRPAVKAAKLTADNLDEAIFYFESLGFRSRPIEDGKGIVVTSPGSGSYWIAIGKFFVMDRFSINTYTEEEFRSTYERE